MSSELKQEIYFLIIRCKAILELLNCLGLGSKGVSEAMDFNGDIDEIISFAGLSISRDLEALLDNLQKYEVI